LKKVSKDLGATFDEYVVYGGLVLAEELKGYPW
jgi:hypothetical protein